MVIRFIAYYHLIQAFLMAFTLYSNGYTVRTDFSGFFSSSTPIFFQLFIGLVLLIISKLTYKKEKEKEKEIKYLYVFVLLWFTSNLMKLFQINLFFINIIWLYLMPSLYYLFKLKNKIIIYSIIISVAISFAVFTALGARGYAIFPLALIFLRPTYDYLMRISFVKRLIIFMILIISSISYMTIIDVYRFTSGRDEINLTSLSNIVSGENKISRDDISLLSGSAVWDRFLNHPMNYLLMDKHKLRGDQYLLEDSFLIFSREKSNYKNVNFGHYTSSNYSFFAKKSSSVECSILSDWTSRYRPYTGSFLNVIPYLFLSWLISLNSKYVLFQSMLVYQLFSSFFVFNFFETLHFIIVAFIINYLIKFIYDLKSSSNRNISR